MNVIALDIGDVRIGIAYGNTNNKVSTPLKVFNKDEILNKSRDFCAIIDDYCPETLVVGLPKSMDGQQNCQVKHIKEIAGEISQIYNLPVEFIDERLSSAEAKRILKAQGLTEKEMKGKIDAVAASLFLETWLAQKK